MSLEPDPSHEELLRLYRAYCRPAAISTIPGAISHDIRRTELKEQILTRMAAGDSAACDVCGAEVPKGQGFGVCVPEEEWVDRSQSRPIKITPLCLTCMGRRLGA